MTIAAFLRSRAATIVPVALADMFVCLVMAVSGCTLAAVALAASALLFGLLVGLSLEYMRGRRFYRSLAQLSEQLEHPYQMASLMDVPKTPDQRMVHEALLLMGQVCASEVLAAHDAQKDQREYMEQWVHEVKAPLAASLLIANRISEPEASQLKCELDRSLREVEQVLWYARSLSPQKDYRIRAVSLLDVAQAACRQNARFLIEQGVAVSFDLSSDLHVFTDEKHAVFVVAQAVVNAAKYGAAHLTFTAQRSRDAAGAQCVTLCIVDDGWGIPEEDVPRVFDRGFTGTRGRQLGSSTGMGLYLAATLCRKLGLGLSLASEEGKGTTVKLTFPFDERRLSLE